MPDDLLALVTAREARFSRRAHASALATLYRVWPELTPEKRMEFLTEVVTAAERRRLLLGLDDWSVDST